MSNTGNVVVNGSIINSMAAKKKMSNMNEDYLIMLKDLKRTESGRTMIHKNKFQRDMCAKQVSIWQKENDIKFREMRRRQHTLKNNLHILQLDKQRIERDSVAEKKMNIKRKLMTDKENNIQAMMKAFMKRKSEIKEVQTNEEHKFEEPKIVPIDRHNQIALINFM